MIFLFLCSFLIRISSQCLTSGVCGGGGYCAPPAPLPCQPTSCQPGYTCGQYGCARNRARSALTKKVDGIFINEDHATTAIPKISEVELEERNIFGLTRSVAKSSKPPLEESQEQLNNVSIHTLTNPNYIFRQCCEERGLPDVCLNKCHFNFYTRNALQAMYFKTDGCPIEATADMHFCAAQGTDHTECCRRNGVTTTLAGSKCLTFCDQRPNRITKLDYSYVPCYDRFEQMKQCFYSEILEKANRLFGRS